MPLQGAAWIIVEHKAETKRRTTVMNYDDIGRRDGHDAGYRDGLDSKPKRPQPALAPSLASIVYLHAYSGAYETGYAQGREARDVILSWRANTEAIRGLSDRSRDDV